MTKPINKLQKWQKRQIHLTFDSFGKYIACMTLSHMTAGQCLGPDSWGHLTAVTLDSCHTKFQDNLCCPPSACTASYGPNCSGLSLTTFFVWQMEKVRLDLKLLTCELCSFFFLEGHFLKIDNALPTVTNGRLLNWHSLGAGKMPLDQLESSVSSYSMIIQILKKNIVGKANNNVEEKCPPPPCTPWYMGVKMLWSSWDIVSSDPI